MNRLLLVIILAVVIIVLIYLILRGIGNSIVPDSSPTPTPQAEVSGISSYQIEMRNLAYSPATLQVPLGSNVKFMNNDIEAHTVSSDNGSFESGQLGRGDSFTFKFDQAGRFNYHCELHPTMRGTIIVQ